MDTDPVHDPLPLTDPPLVLADGTILCQFEINKHEWDDAPWVHKSACIYSSDSAKTWENVVKITEKPGMYYWDQRPNVLIDGKTVVNFFWTFDGMRKQCLNVHGRESRDGGRTWGELWDTGIYR